MGHSFLFFFVSAKEGVPSAGRGRGRGSVRGGRGGSSAGTVGRSCFVVLTSLASSFFLDCCNLVLSSFFTATQSLYYQHSHSCSQCCLMSSSTAIHDYSPIIISSLRMST